MTFVMDCSVTMPWLLQNDKSGYATKVMKTLNEELVIVPRLWYLEVANVLLVYERRKRISQSDSKQFIALLEELPISPDESIYNKALNDVLSTGREKGISAYDAVYLELAMREGLPLATIDRGLKKAAKSIGVAVYLSKRF